MSGNSTDRTAESRAAVLSVASRAVIQQRGQRRGPSQRVFVIALFAFLIAFLLAVLVFGVNAYRAVNDTRVETNEARLGLSLVANSIRSTDVIDAVGVGTGPEGRSLVLTETLDSGVYETRLYAYQGVILQEYARADSPYAPERAREVVHSESFDFEYAGGLLTVHTDQGSTSIALRSVRGGA